MGPSTAGPPLPKTTVTALPDSTKIKSSQPSTDAYPPVKVRTRRTCSITSVLIDILALLWAIFLGVVVAILIVVATVAAVGLTVAFVASSGVITMLIGNSILRATHHAHYTSNASAAYIGAVGFLISMFIVALVMEICVPKTYDEEGRERVPWYIRICASLLVSTLSGTIGCAVLLHNHVDLGGIDVLHATRAGALGGAILAPGMMFVPLVLVLAITFIFSPLWIAISLGARWLWGGSDTTFKLAGRGFKYSACYCSGGNLQEDDLA